MTRVVGIGGVFFKARDPEALRAWYQRHLGLELAPWGGLVFGGGPTVWSLFAADSDYFAPSTAPFMISYRVENLESLLAALKAEGCTVDAKTQDTGDGRFGWVMDPEGNRVELWEPAPATLKP